MLHLSITGVSTPQRHESVRQVLAGKIPYRQGTDEVLLVEYRLRDDAHMALISLNTLDGVRAEIVEDHASAKRDLTC